LKAALLNVMGVAAAYGVVVAVFQWGWGAGLIGVHESVPIMPLAPMLMFAILFGLSMDYEVFLMSRVREEHVRGKATRLALTDGIAGVGRVIVAAALIMSSVFFAFTIGDDRVTKEFGLLLGIAILTDALLVRMTMVPALLTMLGERSWLIPRWLDKALPNLTVEPPGTIEHDVPSVTREPQPEPEPA
jgi:putative drug exporter of the RND superfamily